MQAEAIEVGMFSVSTVTIAMLIGQPRSAWTNIPLKRYISFNDSLISGYRCFHEKGGVWCCLALLMCSLTRNSAPPGIALLAEILGVMLLTVLSHAPHYVNVSGWWLTCRNTPFHLLLHRSSRVPFVQIGLSMLLEKQFSSE